MKNYRYQIRRKLSGALIASVYTRTGAIRRCQEACRHIGEAVIWDQLARQCLDRFGLLIGTGAAPESWKN